MPWFGMAHRYPSRNLFKLTDAKDAFARFFFFFWSNILHPYQERRNKTNCSDVLRHSLNPLLRQLSLLTQVWFTHYTQNRRFFSTSCSFIAHWFACCQYKEKCGVFVISKSANPSYRIGIVVVLPPVHQYVTSASACICKSQNKRKQYDNQESYRPQQRAVL